jgi:hypothetical protein
MLLDIGAIVMGSDERPVQKGMAALLTEGVPGEEIYRMPPPRRSTKVRIRWRRRELLKAPSYKTDDE